MESSGRIEVYRHREGDISTLTDGVHPRMLHVRSGIYSSLFEAKEEHDSDDSEFDSGKKPASRVRLSATSELVIDESYASLRSERTKSHQSDMNGGKGLALILSTPSYASPRLLKQQTDLIAPSNQIETESEPIRENADSSISLLVLEFIGIASLIALLLIGFLIRRFRYTSQHCMEADDQANLMYCSFSSSSNCASSVYGDPLQTRLSSLVLITPNGDSIFVL
uniref:AlNc14C119G6618 protein n=1 Tax=Albugo laibachii Nc14 TaxID=890382 RepID=F0WJ86_9STRA|nr:AlNc14C119G6618 [Albugo laibachii Nc14]|eukprot:CCA21333.1 AlNc14C119G6618 [Albugo laibachii Nc14]